MAEGELHVRERPGLFKRIARPVRRLSRRLRPVEPGRMIMARLRMDVYQKDGEMVYEAEVPGVDRDDLRVWIEDGRLTIAAEAKRDETIERADYARMERTYGRLERSVPVPTDRVDPSQAKGRLDGGIVRVTIPLKTSFIESRRPVDIELE